MEQQTAQTNQTKQYRILFIVTAVWLILNFLWRLLIPAREWASPASVLMTVVFDLIVFAGMCVSWTRLGRDASPDAPPWTAGKILFVAALVAGLGLFALRFLHGDNGWWTGHLIYTLR